MHKALLEPKPVQNDRQRCATIGAPRTHTPTDPSKRAGLEIEIQFAQDQQAFLVIGPEIEHKF